MKIGLFGGTFDPIHLGHLIIANYVLHEFSLDFIHFIPTFQTNYKEFRKNTRHREKMVKLAIRMNKLYVFNDIELRNQEISYTFETIKRIYNKNHEYFLILGDEWLKNFNKWQNYDKIFNYAGIIVVKRNMNKLKIPDFLKAYKSKIFQSSNPFVEISSSMIRDKASRGEDIKRFLPEPVFKYIIKHQLYKDKIK